MKITYKLKYAVQEAQRNGYMAVTSKAQNGEIRIVPIMEILIKPIGSVVGQDSRYNLKYNLKYNYLQCGLSSFHFTKLTVLF